MNENGKSYSASKRRRRVYERRFDWDLARSMYRAGLTIAEIARRLPGNPDRRGVARVVHMRESQIRTATEEEIALAFQYRDRRPCPRCSRPMTLSASLCAPCMNETRLLPMSVRTVLGTPRESRTELRNVEMQRIVEVDGSWGVLVPGRSGRTPDGYRVVDFWDDGPSLVHERIRVRVAPSVEVLVGGVRQDAEEIVE